MRPHQNAGRQRRRFSIVTRRVHGVSVHVGVATARVGTDARQVLAVMVVAAAVGAEGPLYGFPWEG